MKGKKLKIIGLVQGVLYRSNIQNVARDLGLKGTVKNESDGSVTVEVWGEDEIMAKFFQTLQAGIGKERVDEIEISEVDKSKPPSDFFIK